MASVFKSYAFFDIFNGSTNVGNSSRFLKDELLADSNFEPSMCLSNCVMVIDSTKRNSFTHKSKFRINMPPSDDFFSYASRNNFADDLYCSTNGFDHEFVLL